MIDVPLWFPRDVSRETLEKLDAYKALLEKWTQKINLISRSSIQHIADRHIWDSAQVYEKTEGKWADLGSGGGLPAVVVALLAQGWNEALDMTLVESDQRKATFLRSCARELDVPLQVVARRIDAVKPLGADTISARALADLSSLLELSHPHFAMGGTGIFMKGARWQDELRAARKNWVFSCDATESKTNPEAAILKIRDIHRV